MNSLFRLLTIVIFGIASCFDLIAQTEYPTPIEFIFNQTTLNRAVVQQFNKPENPKTINTVINGIPVTFSYVNRPVVEISDALYLRVFFSLTDQLETGLIVENYQVKVPFAIEAIEWNTAPNDGIDDGAYLTLNQTALVSSINGLPVPEERKSLLISILDKVELKRYQILNQSFNEVNLWRLSDFNDFKIKTIPTISTLVDGSFKVVINPIYVAKKPIYTVKIASTKQTEDNRYQLKLTITSNVQFTLNKVFVKRNTVNVDYERSYWAAATKISDDKFEITKVFAPSGTFSFLGDDYIPHIFMNITRNGYISAIEWYQPNPKYPNVLYDDQLKNLNGVVGIFYEH